MPPPPISYIGMYLSSRQVFGQTMQPDLLLDRVRSYGWKPSVTRLAQLAAYVQHPSRTADEIRRRTVDPVLEITGDERATRLVANAREFVARNRNRMMIVHEEVISYLQHLVLVEGGDNDQTPSDAELVFWMLGANCYLGEWAEPDSRTLSTEEELIAIEVRGHCFNKNHNWAGLAVRSYELFRQCPEDDALGGEQAWLKMQLDTFTAPFEQYYRFVLAPLLGVVRRAGEKDGVPAMSLEYWKPTGVDPEWIKSRLNAIAVTRDDARTQILAAEHARDANGLLHAPSLLRRKPLLVDHNDGWLITSQAALATQLHSGPWGAYLEKSKAAHGDSIGFKRWSAAFGTAFERYAGDLARKASASPRFRRNWRLVLPTKPGSEDEIEDVIVIEEDHAALFSIKSTMLPEGSVHRAKSQSAVLDWLERFLFAEDRNFKGAVRKLNANIDEIRAGVFEEQGVSRHLKLHPVLVTYDEIGEDVLLYQHIRRRCSEESLLAQLQVSPLTIASVEEFEWLMEYMHDGRSLVGLLKKRKHNREWFDRRLDQQLGNVRPAVRFKMITDKFNAIFGEVIVALGGGAATNHNTPPNSCVGTTG